MNHGGARATMIGKTSGASLRPQNPTGGRPQLPQQHSIQDLQYALGQTGGGGGMMMNGMNGMNGMQPGGGMAGGIGQLPPVGRDMIMSMTMMRNGSQGMGRGRQ